MSEELPEVQLRCCSSKPRTTDLRPWLWGLPFGNFRTFIPALTYRAFCGTG